MLLDPLHDLSKMLILLSNVVFLTQVDEVDDRLSCKKEERIDDFDL